MQLIQQPICLSHKEFNDFKSGNAAINLNLIAEGFVFEQKMEIDLRFKYGTLRAHASPKNEAE